MLWIAAGLSNVNGSRSPQSQRYVPTDAALFLICVCEAIPRPRVGRLATVVAGAVLLAIGIENVVVFNDSRLGLAQSATASRPALGALLIARKVVDSRMPLPGGSAALDEIRAGPFLSAADAFGTNAFTLRQFRAASDADRHLADALLIEAERLGLRPASGTAAQPGTVPPQVVIGHGKAARACLTLTSRVAAVTAGAPGITVNSSARATASIGVSRFGGGPTPLGTVAAGQTQTLAIPADGAPTISWLIWVRSPATTTICPVS